jgi:hypothetical protein
VNPRRDFEKEESDAIEISQPSGHDNAKHNRSTAFQRNLEGGPSNPIDPFVKE